MYKGSGKDRVDNYRGITLTPMFAKVLEFLVLGRLATVFSDMGVPHINQTSYRKKVSRADPVFATQEVIAKYLNDGDEVFMCLLVMDPLLWQLQASGLGLSISSFYGGFLHDVRTLATSRASLCH